MSTKLYVGNLPFSATDQSLSSYFGGVGTVVSARILTDRDTGRSKGFGFVEMSNADEAQKAIEQLNGSSMEGRQINVAEARPQAPRDNNRTGGGRGFGGGGGGGGGGGRGFGGGRGR